MKPKNTLRSFLSIASIALLTVSYSHAAEVTWDTAPGTVGVGNGTITGGAGTWDTTNGNWTTDAGANNIAWVNANNDTAIFGGTAGTVTLGANVAVGGLTSNTNNYIIAPGTGPFGITFGTPGNINISAGTTNITAAIGGSAITKTGGGALTLSVANTFNGLNLNGGTVGVAGTTDTLGAAGSTITVLGNTTLWQAASGAISLNKNLAVDAGTLTFVHGNNSWTIRGVVSGSATIKVNDAGGINQRPLGLINTANTFTGAIDLLNNRSTITVASLGDTVGSGNIIFGAGNNSAFQLGTTADAPLDLSNRVFEFRGGTTTGIINNLNTASSHANTMTINTDLSVTTAGAKTLQFGGANTGGNVFTGDITDGSGTVSVSKADAGTWILGGANTYTGTTTVTGGTLKANFASALGNGNVTVTAGTLVIDAADAIADTAALRLPSATAKNLTMNANDTVGSLFLGGLQQVNGTYSFGTNASAWMNSGSGTLMVGSAAAQPIYWDLDGATPGAGGATPSGTWNAGNTFWNALSDGTGSVSGWSAGATAVFSAGTDATDNYTVTVDGTQDIGGLTFEEGNVTLTGGTALRLLSDSLASVAPGRTATISTPITQDASARALAKGGSGTLILTSENSFTGATTVGAGTLQLAHVNAIGSSSGLSLANNTTLQMRSDAATTVSIASTTLTPTGSTVTIDMNNNGSGADNQLALSGPVQLLNATGTTTLNVTGGNGYTIRIPTLTYHVPSNGTLTLNPTTSSVQIDDLRYARNSSGTTNLNLNGTTTGNSINGFSKATEGIHGNWLNVYKNDSGTWTWAAPFDINMGLARLRVLAGDLKVTGTVYVPQLGGSPGVELNGGVLHYNSPGAVNASTASDTFKFGGGNLDQTSGAAITTSTYNPRMQWNANFTFLGSNGANSDLNLGTGAVAMNATRQVTIQNADATLTVGGISGAGHGLTKAGAGTLKLGGVNTYTGATTVSLGTLSVTGSLGATTVNVDAGTLAGNGNIGGNVTIASGATHALAVAATPDAQVTRAITGTLTLTSGNILDLTAASIPADGEYVLATATVAITGTPTTVNYNSISGTVSVDNASTPKRLLLTVAAGGSAYETWAGPGVLFGDDANGDGVSNGLAFLLGASGPNVSALDKLPTVTETGGGLVLNFNCLPIAARGGATLKVAHSSDLGSSDPWAATTAVVPDATKAVPDNNVTFVVGAGPVGPPALNSVTATIGSAAAAAGKLFGRLEATE